jgi:hypothetical protein
MIRLKSTFQLDVLPLDLDRGSVEYHHICLFIWLEIKHYFLMLIVDKKEKHLNLVMIVSQNCSHGNQTTF